jgi:hypothetical protein
LLFSDIPNNAMELIRGAAGLEIVGGDVVEVAPQYDATTNTAHAGAQMLFEIFAVVALARTAAAKQPSRSKRAHVADDTGRRAARRKRRWAACASSCGGGAGVRRVGHGQALPAVTSALSRGPSAPQTPDGGRLRRRH